jgi:hypothetical protein
MKVPIPSTGHDWLKKPENVEYLNYFGSMIINDERCTHEIKPMIAIALTAIKRRFFFY